MNPQIKQEGDFQYVEQGSGPAIVVLHGLFGALSNFSGVLDHFSQHYHVIIPIMPLYEKNSIDPSIDGLTDYIEGFIEHKGLGKVTLLGNSLGGHIALVYTLRHPDKVNALVLTGSSGLFESGMGSSFPRRGSREFVEERVAYTFYDPAVATKDLVDEVFSIVNDNFKTLRVVKIARSAQRHNMSEDVGKIQNPSLLIWGLNDNITPPRVAHEFDKLMPNTELRFIDRCGHAPMMERPAEFNQILEGYLNKLQQPA
ncbi:MAG: alpha/beta fold hydrolase [Bacteroidota bacterium]